MVMPTRFTRISPAELKKWLDREEPLTLVDVSTDEQFARHRLPGASNVCVHEMVFAKNIRSLAPDTRRKIVVYGVSAESLDGATGADRLARLGYQDVHLLTGGLRSWVEEGLPLETRAGLEILAVEDLESDSVVWGFLDTVRTYAVDLEESTIHWTGRNSNGKHFGTVGVTDGSLSARDGQLSGALSIDMRTIRNLDVKDSTLRRLLETHLESEDFFNVTMFPKANLTVLAAEPLQAAPLGAANFKMRVSLSMCGVRAEMDMSGTLSWLTTEGPEQGYALEAHFDLDRTRWGVIYGSGRFYEQLGKHLVFDPISIEARLVLR